MATSKETAADFLEKLAGSDISLRPMMGEYIVYCRGKVVGGLYDGRLLVKPVSGAREFLPDAPLELPYASAKPMLRVPEDMGGVFLAELLSGISEQLPTHCSKKSGKVRERN